MPGKDFLGTAAKAGTSIVANEKDASSVSQFFFKPYISKIDFLSRITSIATDFLVFSGYGCFLTLVSAAGLLLSIRDLILEDWDSFNENITDTGLGFIYAIMSIAGAFISPIINTVDFIGSGVSSLLPQDEEPESTVCSM